ncbi:hypothetical protein ABZ816_31750 [Actinosynnema sp. NPDC047251]|uniref:Putative membrane protein n=1 Tax=Saccharothrix espanaensis (strain ATCC 51144 / DSM 44229 / JCM 9112 / NBRC 15066 / NRRL 15764) TaxID=1179773 RepID=K0JR57_SACES|nr:hypothetical protein [Saccharothrix espanaensis]CCH30045.1 putative membrane protein [Saccharothrix espanaensis DSM 44229]
MRLLLWTVLVCACAVHGGESLVLLSGGLLVGCAADRAFTRRRRLRVQTRPTA